MADDVQPVFWHFTYGFVPPLSACEKVCEKEAASLKEFPKALLKALDLPGTKDHETALTVVQCYAAAARNCAFDRGLKDLEAATHRVFAPYRKEVEAALVRALDSKALRVRWKAASDLLAFQPGHAKANSILARGIEAKNKAFRCECCEMIALLHLNTGSAIDLLIRALEQPEPEIRRSAANAVCLIGPKAKATVPALIKLFESGDAARGSVETPFEIRAPRVANLALLALSEMGAEARPAVPVIVRLFPKASKEEQKEMLLCLSRIGRTTEESLALIREAMKGQDSDVRITAACALLRMAPEDETASTLVRRALASQDKKPRTPAPEGPVQLGTFDFMRGDVSSLRRRTLKACADIGPRSKAVLHILTALLADDNEHIRIDATLALGQAGSDAAMAIPALEKLLTKADDHQKHTFISGSSD